MSDNQQAATPRTDALIYGSADLTQHIIAGLCRTLEKELVKRTEELVEARARFNDSTLMQIAAVFQLRAEKAEAEVARLKGLVGRCRPAIALLVEDGDVFVLAKVREHEALLDEIDQGRKE